MRSLLAFLAVSLLAPAAAADLETSDTYLGVDTEPWSRDGSTHVASVTDLSPAQRAGIKVGDQVLQATLGNAPLDVSKLSSLPSGTKSVRLVLQRGGAKVTVPCDLVETYLGVTIQEQSDGWKLTQVVVGTAAERAGLKAGDLVTAFQGTPRSNANPVLARIIRSLPVGRRVKLTVKRGEETLNLEATLGSRVVSPGFASRTEPALKGMRVAKVYPGSPAEAAGLKAGDVVLRLDGRPSVSGYALNLAIRSRRPGRRVSIDTLRGDARRSRYAVLARRPAAEMLKRLEAAREKARERLQAAEEAGDLGAVASWAARLPVLDDAHLTQLERRVLEHAAAGEPTDAAFRALERFSKAQLARDVERLAARQQERMALLKQAVESLADGRAGVAEERKQLERDSQRLKREVEKLLRIRSELDSLGKGLNPEAPDPAKAR